MLFALKEQYMNAAFHTHATFTIMYVNVHICMHVTCSMCVCVCVCVCMYVCMYVSVRSL